MRAPWLVHHVHGEVHAIGVLPTLLEVRAPNEQICLYIMNPFVRI